MTISYIGYKTQEIPVGNGGKKDITMQDDSELMDEVVVIGYGTQRKGDVTSAISSVKSESCVKGAVADAGQLIQGKGAGLNISLPSGDPTGNTQIMLRGISSLKMCIRDREYTGANILAASFSVNSYFSDAIWL